MLFQSTNVVASTVLRSQVLPLDILGKIMWRIRFAFNIGVLFLCFNADIPVGISVFHDSSQCELSQEKRRNVLGNE